MSGFTNTRLTVFLTVLPRIPEMGMPNMIIALLYRYPHLQKGEKGISQSLGLYDLDN